MDLTLQFHPLTRFVHGDRRLTFGRLRRRAPRAAEHGGARFFVGQLDAVFRYGLTDRTEAWVDVPLRRLALDAQVADAHHRDETFQGLGDVRAGLKPFFLVGRRLQAALVLGLSLPTGRRHRVTAASFLTHEEARRLGLTVPKHSHLQLGSGTVDPLLGFEALARPGGGWFLFATALVRTPLYANRDGYRGAPEAFLVLGPARRLGPGRLVAALFGELTWSGRDRFAGEDLVGPGGRFPGRFGVPNTGRFEAAVKPNVVWGLTERLTLTAELRIPVYTRIREDAAEGDVQLTEWVGAFVGLSWNF